MQGAKVARDILNISRGGEQLAFSVIHAHLRRRSQRGPPDPVGPFSVLSQLSVERGSIAFPDDFTTATDVEHPDRIFIRHAGCHHPTGVTRVLRSSQVSKRPTMVRLLRRTSRFR